MLNKSRTKEDTDSSLDFLVPSEEMVTKKRITLSKKMIRRKTKTSLSRTNHQEDSSVVSLDHKLTIQTRKMRSKMELTLTDTIKISLLV